MYVHMTRLGEMHRDLRRIKRLLHLDDRESEEEAA
jgi:hypothetical protein